MPFCCNERQELIQEGKKKILEEKLFLKVNFSEETAENPSTGARLSASSRSSECSEPAKTSSRMAGHG